ncbi:SPOR domain-containing protein [Aquabacterium sp. A08]|uniref:SPOR domain-containing protein n=1 Tax=Aquabacterium sp. A08 TaxID=2718532 RepID=UPI00141DEACA|nr:SPOR domain-containing protein [Aquabacterium sp. A08]NIC40541.1 SPOR domain-containing protein [Aquabacterium sp. A08]
MFNLRSGGQGNPSPAQPPTIEAIRRRARHRLIGASVLVLAGVIGFPLLFDTQPRPIAVDIPIDIPAKHTAAPLVVAPAAPAAQVQVAGVTEREEVLPTAPIPVPSVPVAATAPAPAPEPPRPAAAAPAPTKAPEPPAKPAAAPVPSDAARAQALLDGKPPAPTAVRTVVQVGAFAEQARAQEVRQKLERAGLKTYTHVADTPEGKRIRVRLGPFDSRAEAEAAATKVKALGLPAAVLTL